jgi:hypothetical protein
MENLMTRTFEINDDNFEQYFTSVKKGKKPEKCQVLASWRAAGDFEGGWVKKNVLEILVSNKSGAEPAIRVMRNVVGAIEKDAIRICREMANDFMDGMSEDEIMAKPYRFVLEQFYWVEPKYVPENDPHWTIIKTIDLTTFSNYDEVDAIIPRSAGLLPKPEKEIDNEPV